MRVYLLLLLPMMLFSRGVDLRTLIEHAATHNGNIKAKTLAVSAKSKEVESAQRAYWPTLDVGADYSWYSPNYLVSPGEVGNAYVSLNLDLYDGGRKAATVRAKRFEKEASRFEKEAFSKSVTLEIVRRYYTVKKLLADLKALAERGKELSAQIVRIRKFKLTGLATQEDVDKLQAVLDNNSYTTQNTRLALETARENLKLLTGLDVAHLASDHFISPSHVRFEWFDLIKQMDARAKSIGANAEALDAAYLPQVKFSDTYTRSHYGDQVAFGGFLGINGDTFLVDHQNVVGVSVNMRLFDNGHIAKQSEAVRLQKMALRAQILQAKREQKMRFKLAGKNLHTLQAKLKSAKSALNAAKSTYVTVRKKFEAGIVDNIAFLDALAQKTLTEARYKETLYDNEIAKSLYYYYAGKEPKEFVR